MSVFASITPVFLDTIVGRLMPWLLLAAGGVPDVARQAVRDLLASYNVDTDEELRLAAEITSFGFSALEALSQSVDPDLSLNVVLRLRGSANAAQRSARQCQRALDKLRKDRRTAAPDAQTRAPMSKAPLMQAPQPGQPVPASPRAEIPMSRQQRRAMERDLEKARGGQAEQDRRAAMRAARSGATEPSRAIRSPADSNPHPLAA
jgi:hypothetical protein